MTLDRLIFIVLTTILISTWAISESKAVELWGGELYVKKVDLDDGPFDKSIPGGDRCLVYTDETRTTCEEKINIDRFYDKERWDVFANVLWGKQVGPHDTVLLNSYLYSGYDSSKYDIEPTVWLGITWEHKFSETLKLTAGVSPTIVIGGGVRETSCVDTSKRYEFYCSSIDGSQHTKWEEYTPAEDLDDSWKASLKLTWKF